MVSSAEGVYCWVQRHVEAVEPGHTVPLAEQTVCSFRNKTNVSL
jgi:hypothetical protein